jgi:hypothetical protein
MTSCMIRPRGWLRSDHYARSADADVGYRCGWWVSRKAGLCFGCFGEPDTSRDLGRPLDFTSAMPPPEIATITSNIRT